LDIGPSQVGRQSSERVYDPYWTNARNFLDFAEGAGLLVRDAAQARLGQLVLITGRLTVLDTRIVKEAIALPQFANSAIASSVADGTDLETSQFGLEMLKVLPMEVQATITDGGGSTWMTLAPAYISGSTADLMLKHGHQVAGDWSVVGILDALPDAGGHLDTAVQQAMDTAMVSAAAFQTNAIGLIAMLIAPLARMAMGRPAAARGVTPLLIFREVTGG
jgi:hypothetical protein